MEAPIDQRSAPLARQARRLGGRKPADLAWGGEGECLPCGRRDRFTQLQEKTPQALNGPALHEGVPKGTTIQEAVEFKLN